MSKHTPGPWVAELGEAYNIRAPHGGIAAQVLHLKGRHGMGGRVPSEEAAANARLIAAAPELLEALQDALMYLQHHLPDEALIPHRAAIAKATGQSK